MDLIMEPFTAEPLADDMTESMMGVFPAGGANQMGIPYLDAYLRAIGALPPAADSGGFALPGYGGVSAEVETLSENAALHGYYTHLADVKVPAAPLPPPPGFPPLPVPITAARGEPVYAAPALHLSPPPGFLPFPDEYANRPVGEVDAVTTFTEMPAWSPLLSTNSATSRRRPQLCAPYDDDIEATLRATEKDAAERPKPDYLRTVHGNHITASTRAALIEWMENFTRQYNLAAGTLHRAVSYVDRFLSVRAPPSYTDDHKLSLLGAAAVYTAAKYEDQSTVFKVNAREIASYGGFASAQEVLHMESEIVAALDYRLGGPTAETFVEHFTRYCQNEEELLMQRLARHVADESLKCYGCVGFLPSVVGAASITTARWILNLPFVLDWQELTGYHTGDIIGCSQLLLEQLNIAANSV